MNDGLLSQEEINALLNADTETPAAEQVNAQEELTVMEIDALGEIGNISMGSAATTLSILLSNKVNITTPKVQLANLAEIKQEYPLPYLVIEVGYTAGLDGVNILAIKEKDALIIADLMMGGDGTTPPTELSELYMSAVSEAMNQMMGATATSMSTMFKKKIDIAPPKVSLVDFGNDGNLTDVAEATTDPVVKIAFRMEVGTLIDSEIMQIISLRAARELVNNLLKPEATAPAVTPQPSAPVVAPPPPAPVVSTAPPMVAAPPPAMGFAQPVYAPPPTGNIASNIPVQQVQFAPLNQQQLPLVDGNIGLLMDVPLQVTVELGRTKKLIREILDFGPGSVMELDKLAGEPVDVFVNTKLVAKGEVVVIDENFGVRITEIVNPLDRIGSLQ